MTKIQQEPVLTAAGLASLISAVVIFLRAMNWLPLTDEQYTALMGVVALAAPLLTGWLYARPRVTPTADPKIVVDGKVVLLMPASEAPE